jgi:hypothetical protein
VIYVTLRRSQIDSVQQSCDSKPSSAAIEDMRTRFEADLDSFSQKISAKSPDTFVLEERMAKQMQAVEHRAQAENENLRHKLSSITAHAEAADSNIASHRNQLTQLQRQSEQPKASHAHALEKQLMEQWDTYFLSIQAELSNKVDLNTLDSAVHDSFGRQFGSDIQRHAEDIAQFQTEVDSKVSRPELQMLQQVLTGTQAHLRALEMKADDNSKTIHCLNNLMEAQTEVVQQMKPYLYQANDQMDTVKKMMSTNTAQIPPSAPATHHVANGSRLSVQHLDSDKHGTDNKSGKNSASMLHQRAEEIKARRRMRNLQQSTGNASASAVMLQRSIPMYESSSSEESVPILKGPAAESRARLAWTRSQLQSTLDSAGRR